MRTPTTWAKTSEAAKALGISPDTLHRRRQDGSLLAGRHYRALKGKLSKRAAYRWNVAAILKELQS